MTRGRCASQVLALIALGLFARTASPQSHGLDLAPGPAVTMPASYVVPHYESSEPPAPERRSSTLVRVSNPSRVSSCEATVEFRGRHRNCTLTRAIGPGQTSVLCSRRVFHPLLSCGDACPGGVQPTGPGRAYVSSSCAGGEVRAQIVYTRDRFDRDFAGVSDLDVRLLAGSGADR